MPFCCKSCAKKTHLPPGFVVVPRHLAPLYCAASDSPDTRTCQRLQTWHCWCGGSSRWSWPSGQSGSACRWWRGRGRWTRCWSCRWDEQTRSATSDRLAVVSLVISFTLSDPLLFKFASLLTNDHGQKNWVATLALLQTWLVGWCWCWQLGNFLGISNIWSLGQLLVMKMMSPNLNGISYPSQLRKEGKRGKLNSERRETPSGLNRVVSQLFSSLSLSHTHSARPGLPPGRTKLALNWLGIYKGPEGQFQRLLHRLELEP